MIFSQIASYAAVVLTLVVLEGLLSADNALVLAVMANRLPKAQQTKALLFGIYGAFFFRGIGVILAGWLIHFWWFMAIGAAYLLYLPGKHFWLLRKEIQGKSPSAAVGAEVKAEGALSDPPAADLSLKNPPGENLPSAVKTRKLDANFWKTVLAIELTDIAFSIDSIVAAVALVQDPRIAPAHQVWLVYLGGILGIIAMRLVAGVFLRWLEIYPMLAHAAYLLVGWIGIKLSLESFGHAVCQPDAQGKFPHFMPAWLFWTVMVIIFVGGMWWKPAKSAQR